MRRPGRSRNTAKTAIYLYGIRKRTIQFSARMKLEEVSQNSMAVRPTLPLALTSLLMLYPVAVSPLLQFEVAGMRHQFIFLDGLSALNSQGLLILTVLLGWCTLGAIFVKNAAYLLQCIFPALKTRMKTPLRVSTRFATIWESPEVFLLGILVCVLSLANLGATRLTYGFYFLVALWIISGLAQRIAGNQGFNPKGINKAGPNRAIAESDTSTVWALVLTSFLLFIPAMVYPVATFTLNGVSEKRTILGGVSDLIEEGKPLLAAIVFTASVVVPVLKLAGLSFLLLSIHYGGNRKRVAYLKLYRVIQAAGRWALLDIFIILILTSIVDFGFLATIKPEPAGIYAFSALVVTTLLAAECFDQRLLIPTEIKFENE